MKRDIIAGNWKMNKTQAETKELIASLVPAVANANSLKGIDAKDLIVSSISVDGAPSRRGVRFASRSRVARLIKRRSHINLILSEK